MENYKPPQTTIDSILSKAPPKSPKSWGFLLITLLTFILMLTYSYFNLDNQEQSTLKPNTNYKVKSDPDDLRRQEIIDENIATEKFWDDLAPAKKPITEIKAVPYRHVRLASAQIYSKMGDKTYNRKKMTAYIEKAAKAGAKFIVFPEAALSGYANPNEWNLWAINPKTEESDYISFLSIKEVAEIADGESFHYFSELANKHQIYIALPYIEFEPETDKYFSSLTLISPSRTALLKYRKAILWSLADPYWTSPTPFNSKTAETAFGKVGLLISYDIHKAVKAYKDNKPDIILHSSALYGQNLNSWMKRRYLPMIKQIGSSLIMADWGVEYAADLWEGYGLSRIINSKGQTLSSRSGAIGEVLLLSDILIPGKELFEE